MPTLQRHNRPSGFLARSLVVLLATVHGASSQSEKMYARTEVNAAAPAVNSRVHPFSTDRSGLSLKKFIHWASLALGKPFAWSPEATQITKDETRTVTLTEEMTVPDDELLDYVRTHLRVHDLALIPMGPPRSRFILIAPIKSAAFTRARKTYVNVEDLEDYKDTYIPIMTTIHLEHVNVFKIQSQIQPLVRSSMEVPGHGLFPLSSENAIVIIDFGPDAYNIARLIREMDRQGDRFERSMESIPLEHLSPGEMEAILAEILQEDHEQLQKDPRYAQRVDRIPPRAHIIPSDRAGNLVVYATKSDHEKIRALVSKLDVGAPVTTGDVLVYSLRNTVAGDIADTLKEIMNDTGRSTSRRGSGPGQASLSTRSGDERLIIVPDPGSNALLIRGPRSRIEEVVEIVKKLDIRKPQVLVEAAILELRHTDTLDLGVEVGAFDAKKNLEDTTRPFGFTNMGLSSVGLTETGLTRIPNVGSPGFVGGIFNGDGFLFPILVQAFQSKDNTNLLSMPSLLTNDNESATIRVMRSIPYTQLNQGAPGQVSTQSFKAFENAPIELTISPHISSEDYLRLDITFIVEVFGAGGSPGIPPPKTGRTIITSVTVPDGATVVIGGLTLDEQIDATNQVPILGDIPLLGALFRSTEKIHNKNTLFLFLTPRILSDSEFNDLDEISQVKKAEAAALGGQIDLVDPESGSRFEMLDQTRTLEDVEASGIFDLPVLHSAADGKKRQR